MPNADRRGFTVFPANQPALELFLSCQTQWRAFGVGVSIIWLGLDYQAVRAAAEMMGMETSPTLFADLRVMESAATLELNGASPQ